MKTNPIVTAGIIELITRHPKSRNLSLLTEEDLRVLAEAAADRPIRIATARWMSVPVLVQNRENLRPAVRTRLEDQLAAQATAICRARGFEEPIAGDPATDPVSEPTQNEASETASEPEPAIPPEIRPQVVQADPPKAPYREDWFDSFLTFMSNIFR